MSRIQRTFEPEQTRSRDGQKVVIEADMAAAAGFGEHTSTLRWKTSGEQTKHVPPDEWTRGTAMEARLGANWILQRGKPDQEPVASRTMDWNPYSNCKRLETGWSKGRWRSNVQRQCLYHQQTRTAVSLIGGDDLGHFGLKWTKDGEPMVLDIDNVDFCVDPIEIVLNGSLDDPDLEGEIGQKLRMVLTGRKLPAQELKFKPATVYKNMSTSQLVAIVGSPEHANAEEIKHVLVAEVTNDGEINIEKITKAKKEELVKENGRRCNEEKMLADIRRIYFQSFARSQQPLWQLTTKELVNMASPAGDLCPGDLLLQGYNQKQRNEQRKNKSDGNSLSGTFDISTSNERNLMEQLSDMEKLTSDVQEENNRLQQESFNSKDKIENLTRENHSLKEQIKERQQVEKFNFDHYLESQQEKRTLTKQLEQDIQTLNQQLSDSRQENNTLNLQLSTSRQENLNLSQQLSTSRQEVQNLNQQLSTSRQENQTINQQLSDSRQENQTINQELSDNRQENQTLNQQLSDSRQENQTLNQELSDNRQENQTLNQELSDSRQENQTINQWLSDSRQEIQTLNQWLSTSRQENQNLNQQLSTSRQENQNLSQRLSDGREEIQNLQQRLSDSEDERQSLQEQLSNSQALCSHQHHLLLGADMVETSLPHIEFLASDCCLFATHRAKCLSCQLVSPFLDHMRMCSNSHCEKCNKIVNLYTVHVSHCQETNCNFPYCMRCKRFSQQQSLSTQHLATDPEFHEEVRNCLRAIPSQVKRDDAVFHLGEPDPYHKYQSSHAVQIFLLKMFPSYVIPIEKLVVECFKHHEEWSSLRHKKSCPSCQIFLQVLQKCGSCHLDKCFTCGNACCACAKHVLNCQDMGCKFPFCRPPFNKGRVGPGDTIFPTEETLSLFRECVRQLCFPQG